MAVVFDEVVANVEAPDASLAEDVTPQQRASAESDEQRFIQIVETEQRRQQRLMAD